jgi:sterol carrier protein 2
LHTGATGLAQCAELTWHLRGWANNRLVKDTRYCLQHNLGLGGAVVVTVYKRADGKTNSPVSDDEVGRQNGLGYNPATQAKGFTTEQVRRTVSQKQFSDWAVQDVQSKVQSRF